MNKFKSSEHMAEVLKTIPTCFLPSKGMFLSHEDGTWAQWSPVEAKFVRTKSGKVKLLGTYNHVTKEQTGLWPIS